MTTDVDLEQRSKKVAEKVSENLHIIANEPSLALYRLQEHVRKSLPQLVEKRLEVSRIHQELQGKCYDAEYAVNAVKGMQASSVHFQNIHDLLKNAIFMKQQLTYEENRRQDRKSQASMYQRLSSLSLDLADLPAALRPVASVLSASSSDTNHPSSNLSTSQLILEINSSVASFRDLLINIGHPKDCPELRDKIRKVRRQCVDICKTTNQILLPQVKRDVAEGIPVDNQDLVHLFCLAQLLIRELKKCKRLVVAVPMDMTDYLLNRPGPSGMSVLGQIILCRQLAPDFNLEELSNIDRDTDEVCHLVDEMQEYMPKEDNGKNLAFQEETFLRWHRRRRKQTIRWQRLLRVNCR